MKLHTLTTGMALGALALGLSAVAQNTHPNENQGQGKAVVTILPAHDRAEAPATISAQDLSIKIGGKESAVTGFTSASNSPLELVILLDSGARTSISTQLGDIRKFVQTLPPSSKVAIGYMQNGISRLTGPLTADRDAALKGLHIPAGMQGENASPYFCLSDLAKRWPSSDRSARREVVMITDGVDSYHPGMDLDDPYVDAAIHDAAHAGLVVYSIYWQNRGRYDQTMVGSASGQDLLLQVTKATGGNSYWVGTGNPVSFQPYFKDLARRFQNQYELSFTAALRNRAQLEDLKLKVNGISGKVDAPGQVYVTPSI